MTLIPQSEIWISEIWPRERPKCLLLLYDSSNREHSLMITTLIDLVVQRYALYSCFYLNISYAFVHIIFRVSVSPSITWEIQTSWSLKPPHRSDILSFYDSRLFHLLSWYLSEVHWWRTHPANLLNEKIIKVKQNYKKNTGILRLSLKSLRKRHTTCTIVSFIVFAFLPIV